MTKRAFVLVPLAELAPALIVLGTEKTVGEFLRDLGEEEIRNCHQAGPIA